MITTLFLDIGGTVFIKKEDGTGMINPAIIYLNKQLPKNISVVLLSDTEQFDVPELLSKTFPELEYDAVYTKMMYPWIDKTKSETYVKICNLIQRDPGECVLIDNQDDFKQAAESAGIKTYGIDQHAIEYFLFTNVSGQVI